VSGPESLESADDACASAAGSPESDCWLAAGSAYGPIPPESTPPESDCFLASNLSTSWIALLAIAGEAEADPISAGARSGLITIPAERDVRVSSCSSVKIRLRRS